MASAYRYEDPRRGTQNRTRTGLAGVGTGNGGAAPYQLAALQPGMRGFWASGFGAAPTGETPDRQPDAPAAPAATQTAAPTVMAPDPNPVRTDSGEGAQIGVVDGEPGNLDLFGDLGINGKTVGGILGGAVGSLAGPLGGIAGALGGRALGAMFDGGGSAGAAGMGGDPANAQSAASENAAANSGASQAGNMMGDGTYAEGGRVTHLFKGHPMQQHGKKGAGLRGAGMGGGYMGAYSMGGKVPNYAQGGMVEEQALAGPNPPGPDDGFAALDGGEYVVRAQQAQRPDYAPILEQINQGTYDPEGAGTDGVAETQGNMPAEGGSMGADPSSLPPIMQMALGQAVAGDPMLAQALTSLLGPDAVQEIMASSAGKDMAMPAEHETPFGRPPLAGPKPPPGINAPPGVRPPAAATPSMPMPPPMAPGLRGVMA